jgi:hypothetical protein
LLSIEGVPFCRIEASTQPYPERGALYIASDNRTDTGLVLHMYGNGVYQALACVSGGFGGFLIIS